MEEKEEYIQSYLQNNPSASRKQAELSYFTNGDLQEQIRKGYANADGTLNSFRVDQLRNIDVRTPFGTTVNGQYLGPSIEDYIMSGVNGRHKYDVRVNTDIPGVEKELLGIDQTRTHMIGHGLYPNFKVVGEYEGIPNLFAKGHNIQYKKQIEEGTQKRRYEGNQRHVIVKDDNGRIFDLNLDLPHEGLGEEGNLNFPEGIELDNYYKPYKGENQYRRSRWQRLNTKDGKWLPKIAWYAENHKAAEDIKINPDGTITHYNPMRYSIPEVEKARQMNAQPDNLFHEFANGGHLSTRKDNIFPQSHRFADGGSVKTTTQSSDNSDGLSDDDIDNLALQTRRGVYGNGKKRKEALGDAYAAVQKRVNEMIKE